MLKKGDYFLISGKELPLLNNEKDTKAVLLKKKKNSIIAILLEGQHKFHRMILDNKEYKKLDISPPKIKKGQIFNIDNQEYEAISTSGGVVKLKSKIEDYYSLDKIVEEHERNIAMWGEESETDKLKRKALEYFRYRYNNEDDYKENCSLKIFMFVLMLKNKSMTDAVRNTKQYETDDLILQNHQYFIENLNKIKGYARSYFEYHDSYHTERMFNLKPKDITKIAEEHFKNFSYEEEFKTNHTL